MLHSLLFKQHTRTQTMSLLPYILNSPNNTAGILIMLVINKPSHIIILLLFLTGFLYSAITKAQPTYTNSSCSATTFVANSSFQSDLTNLFSSLASNNTANTNFFNTTVHGGGGKTLYGLFMCRGDVTLQLCHQCVVDATNNIRSLCNVSKEAVIWYEECMVRYSDRYFFSNVDTTPKRCGANSNNVANNQTGFMDVLSTTMNKAADEAAKSALGQKKFATEEASLEFQTIYCLVQCTPDLSPKDCRTCLRDAIGELFNCSDRSIGGRVLYPSCNVRYELFIFYNSSGGPVPPPPALLSTENFSQGKTKTIVKIVVSICVAAILLCLVLFLLLRNLIKKRRRSELRKKYLGDEGSTLERLQFSLATIEAATNKFSQENCLGQGGFGQVYKGILSNGQEIAVKRLSEGSRQGAEEFKNEVLSIAKLQHRNLVALLGFCIEEQEKILIYEYVPNKSLDHFLFGSNNDRRLNWEERHEIIRGVAQGILYLHDYSRFKIIHRDLKPSNILLDDKINPKISDFGLARMVAINENNGNTRRIVGTYGYMPPEYAMFGIYSEKSDIFSFGVIVLQIISGKKNASCHNDSHYADSLLSYTWNQWRNENLLEMLDPNLKEMESYNEVTRCIQIGLLCVQKHREARPSMATVVSYLTDESIELPRPQQPAFILHPRRGMTSASREYSSINEMSISEFFPR